MHTANRSPPPTIHATYIGIAAVIAATTRLPFYYMVDYHAHGTIGWPDKIYIL